MRAGSARRCRAIARCRHARRHRILARRIRHGRRGLRRVPEEVLECILDGIRRRRRLERWTSFAYPAAPEAPPRWSRRASSADPATPGSMPASLRELIDDRRLEANLGEQERVRLPAERIEEDQRRQLQVALLRRAPKRSSLSVRTKAASKRRADSCRSTSSEYAPVKTPCRAVARASSALPRAASLFCALSASSVGSASNRAHQPEQVVQSCDPVVVAGRLRVARLRPQPRSCFPVRVESVSRRGAGSALRRMPLASSRMSSPLEALDTESSTSMTLGTPANKLLQPLRREVDAHRASTTYLTAVPGIDGTSRSGFS